MNGPGQEFVELFLQEASEHLQFLREYSGILLDPYPMPDDIERLYISAHGIAGTAGTYGYLQFSEVAGKLAHIFQYAMNASVSADAAGPLVEFITEGIAVLESDLIAVSENGNEAADDILAFKQRYPFAFQVAVQQAEPEPIPAQPGVVAEPKPVEEAAFAEPELISDDAPLGDLIGEAEPIGEEAAPVAKPSPVVARVAAAIPDIPADGDVPAEVMEFFVPEVEEHLQVVTECLLSLEAAPNPEEINRLFRAMHTI